MLSFLPFLASLPMSSYFLVSICWNLSLQTSFISYLLWDTYRNMVYQKGFTLLFLWPRNSRSWVDTDMVHASDQGLTSKPLILLKNVGPLKALWFTYILKTVIWELLDLIILVPTSPRNLLLFSSVLLLLGLIIFLLAHTSFSNSKVMDLTKQEELSLDPRSIEPVKPKALRRLVDMDVSIKVQGSKIK